MRRYRDTITSSEVVIPVHRLAELERKERGHDAYLWATRRMADKARISCSDYARALYDFCELVAEAPMTD
jgi:hypothetical protein